MAPSSTVKVVSDTVTAAVSSSVTVTATEPMVTVSYSSALPAASTVCAIDAVSSTASVSWAAATVTVWAVSQLLVVNVSVVGVRVTSELPVVVVLITTSEVGGAFSFTV